MNSVDVSGVRIQQAPAGNEVSGRQWRVKTTGVIGGRLRRAKAERGGAGLKLLTKAVVSDDGAKSERGDGRRMRSAASAGGSGEKSRRSTATSKSGSRSRKAKAVVEGGRRRRLAKAGVK